MKNKIGYIILYLIVVVLSILLFSYKFEISENGYVIYDTLQDIESDNAIDIVKNNDVINQDYTIAQDNVKYLKIYFNTDVIDDEGSYQLELIDEKGNVVFSKTIDYLETVTTSGAYKVKLKNVAKGDYTLSLKYTGNDTNFCPLVNHSYEENTYSVNNEEYTGLIQTETLYVNKVRTIAFYVGMAFFVVVISILAYIVGIKKNGESLEKKFLYIAIPIYVLYLLFIPLYVAHDELFHWYRIFEITEGGLLPEIQNDSTGYVVPSAVGSGLPWGEVRYIDIIKELADRIDYNNKEFISDVTMSVYSPIQYLPHIIGVIIGKAIFSSPIVISYYGRIFNMVACIALLYFAIKRIPYGKKLIFLISFIPIAIEGFVSLSGDGFTISIAMLFISYILEIYNSKRKMEKKDYAILGILGTVIAFCKIVYIPIVLLLIILPKESFGSNKKKYMIIVPLMIFFVCCNLLWLALANPYLNVYTNGKSGYQIKYVLTHPIKYCQNFLYTIQTNGIGYLTEIFGKDMLWSNAVKNNTFVPLILIFLTAYICINDELKNRFKLKEIIVILLIILGVVALMFTSLYVQWTRYSSDIIEGVQGRYFLPIISLVFLLIGNFIGKEVKKENKKFEQILIVSCIFVSFMCLMELFTKYI